MEKSLKYLGVPAIVFFAFTLAAIFGGEAIQDFIIRTIGKTFDFLPYFVSICAWLSAAILLNRVLNILFWNLIIRRIAKRAPPRLLIQISNFLVYALAVAGIVGVVFEESLTGLLATSGVVGLVMGFALRSIILDLFSGLSINLERPFVIGDFVQIHIRGAPMVFGIIDEVNWRTTRVKTLENTLEIIPNSVLGSSVITNMTCTGPLVRYHMTIGFDISIDPERVVRLINAGLREASRQKRGPTAFPLPKVKLSSYEQGNNQYKIKYYVDTSKSSPGAARQAVLYFVFQHVQKAGLKPAYDKKVFYEAPVAPLALDTMGRIKETLRQSIVSSALSEQDIEDLAQHCAMKTVPARATILAAGEQPDRLRILNEGILDLMVKLKEGEEPTLLDSYKAGDLVGAMIGSANTYEIFASTPVSIVEIPKEIQDTYPSLMPCIADDFEKQVKRHADKLVELEKLQQQELEEEKQKSAMGNIANRIRGFFKSRMKGGFASALRSLSGKNPQQQLVNAALASCALVAAADGRLDEAERNQVLSTLNNLDLFQDISSEEGLAIFDGFIVELMESTENSQKRLLGVIRESATDEEMAPIILEICKAVSASDGQIDVTENAQIAEITQALGIPA